MGDDLKLTAAELAAIDRGLALVWRESPPHGVAPPPNATSRQHLDQHEITALRHYLKTGERQ